MSKENVISLAEKAIENILKERERRKVKAIETFRNNFKPTRLQKLGWKAIPELTDEYVLGCISVCMWDYPWLIHYGAETIDNIKQLISAAQVAEDYMLVDVSMANSLNIWGQNGDN
jgi:hypothetical protein